MAPNSENFPRATKYMAKFEEIPSTSKDAIGRQLAEPADMADPSARIPPICKKVSRETRPLQWYDLPSGSKNVLFKVSFTSQTSGSNNKLDIGTFKLGHPRLTNSKTNNKRDIGSSKFGHHRLTLNEGPKVKSDHIKRFPVHVFP